MNNRQSTTSIALQHDNGVKVKIFFRYFLFLTLCFCCYITSVGTNDHVGYAVRNNYGVGPSGQKWRETGPNRDVTVKPWYGSITNNLVSYKPIQLGPTGASLKWAQLDSASGGGFLYRNRSGGASGGSMYIESRMVGFGKSHSEHKLFKASVPGLYCTLAVSNIWSIYTYTGIGPSGVYIGNSTNQSFNQRGESEQTLYWSCSSVSTKNKYRAVNSVMQTLTIELYINADFNPTTNQWVTLPRTDNYPYSFKVYSVGIGVNDYNYFSKTDFDLTDTVLANPTYFTAVLSGPSVGGSTIKMGDCTPAQVKNGVTAAPLDITLQNCTHVHNIETKPKSNKMGSVSEGLLASALIGNDTTKGIDVLTEGLENIRSTQMVLEPNDAASIYRDYETKNDTTRGIFPDQGSGTSQPPHFQATLERDDNIAIEPGDSKATNTFQTTYPR